MAKTFTLDLPPDLPIGAGLALARRKAAEVGITITGDLAGGTFEGMASGTYRVEGRVLTLEVQKKPPFVPWFAIESGLRSVFGGTQGA